MAPTGVLYNPDFPYAFLVTQARAARGEITHGSGENRHRPAYVPSTCVELKSMEDRMPSVERSLCGSSAIVNVLVFP